MKILKTMGRREIREETLILGDRAREVIKSEVLCCFIIGLNKVRAIIAGSAGVNTKRKIVGG